MGKTLDHLTATSVENQEQAIGLIEKLLTVARPDAVFSQPIEAEGRTVITASEVNVGLGVGFGFGGGMAASEDERGVRGEQRHGEKGAMPRERVVLEGADREEGDAVVGEEPEETAGDVGMGAGGGGGGGASGRPVAVISISDEGVRVEPVVDVTKIALAFFTAFGSMAFMLAKMHRAAQD